MTTSLGFLRGPMQWLSCPKVRRCWTFLLVGLMTDGCGAPERASVEARKDVLFIIVDDLNKALSAYGHPQVLSPNVDRLAAMGLLFEQAHCNYSVCNPSRSSLLTGLRPETTTVLNNRIPLQSVIGEHLTLPALFQRNGYHTVNIGKIFHRPEPEHNDREAWDEFYQFSATATGKSGESRNLTDDIMRWCYWRAAEGTDEDLPDGQTGQKAVEIIQQSRDQPLFLAVGLAKPHDPYIAPKKYFDLYPLAQMNWPEVPAGWETPYEHAFPLENPVFPKGKEIFDAFSAQDKKEFLRSYYACITFMDAQLGKILDALEASGKMESTHIVLFSDHGYHLGEHNWWNKFTLYEQSTSAPLIVAGPAIAEKGTRTDAMIEFVDIYPTMAEIAGLEEVPADLEGESFRRLLETPTDDFRPFVRSVMTRKGDLLGKSIKTNEWRYIEWEEGRAGNELYDQVNDPQEYVNLVDEPASAAVVERLKQWMKEGRK